MHYYPDFRPYEARALPNIQELARTRIVNHLYWLNQISIVPWIIGETSFSAFDSLNWNERGLNGTLTDQGDYVQFSLDAVCNCGGSGYSWWQYQDVSYHLLGKDYHRNYFGLLYRSSNLSSALEKQPAINNFRTYTPQNTGNCPVDYSPTFDEKKIYYNPYKHSSKDKCIASYVVDQENNPIKDAVVKVWVNNGDEYITYTDITGYFKAIPSPLYGFAETYRKNNLVIVQIRISAAGATVYESKWSTTHGTTVPDTVKLYKIKDNVIISGENVLSGQNHKYSGRKSLTVSNTTIQSGGVATFTSQKSITLLPGFVAHAGSEVCIYIAPDCDELSLLVRSENMLDNNTKVSNKLIVNKEIKVSFEPDFLENFISVFPNPANSTVHIKLHGNNPENSLISIKLKDLTGREMLFQQVNTQSYSIDISSYPKGFYFIEAKDTNTIYHQKIIIQ